MINKIKKNNSISKYITILILSCLTMMSIGYSATQTQMLRYQFEEGVGSIVFDTSGNGNDGIVNGASWSGTARWGTYSLSYDGNNDYVTRGTGCIQPSEITFSFWFNRNGLAGQQSLFQSIMSVSALETLQFYYDSVTLGTDHTYFDYKDVSGTIQTLNLETNELNTGQWYHALVSINKTGGTLTYYRDNILINSFTGLTFYNSTESCSLRLGSNFATTQDYSGLMDEFRIFNFIANETQRSSLFLSNDIALVTDPTPLTSEVTNFVEYSIINYTTPVGNETLNNLMKFTGKMNDVPATCELYLDNSLFQTFYNTLAYSYEYRFDGSGTHQYFLYCYFDSNNDTRYYELSPSISFTVSYMPQTIEFYLYDQQDNLYFGENLYLVTPCLKEYAGYYQQYMNSRYSYYFQKVDNGYATFNLPYTSEYDFCLVRGQINVDEDNFTKSFDLVKVNKQVDLGTLMVKNDTYQYAFRLTNEDLYNIYEPSFWQKTWAELFNVVLALVVGGIIIILGLIMKSEKIIIAGVFIILAGMGVSTFNIIGGVLF